MIHENLYTYLANVCSLRLCSTSRSYKFQSRTECVHVHRGLSNVIARFWIFSLLQTIFVQKQKVLIILSYSVCNCDDSIFDRHISAERPTFILIWTSLLQHIKPVSLPSAQDLWRSGTRYFYLSDGPNIIGPTMT